MQPRKHPLITLLTNIGKFWDGSSYTGAGIQKAVTTNVTFDCFEDFYGGRYAKVSGTYAASGDVTITVTGAGSSSGHIFTPGDIVLNARTGERMLVDSTTVPTATTFKVLSAKRAFGTTAAAAGADGDGLYIVGNTSEQNSGARNVNSTRSAKESNYTQIFKKTIALSRSEAKSATYGGGDLPYQRSKAGTEHAADIERAFWFSEKKSTTGANGHPMYATGGILEGINSKGSYVQDQGGPLTAPDLDVFLREGFTYGNETKTLFCGGIVLSAINEFARGQLVTKNKDTSYGVQIQEYVSAHGVINLVRHPYFVQDYAGYAFLIDMECFRYRYLTDSDTKLFTNVQAPDTDGEIDQYITECGLERKEMARNALLKGVTA